MLVKALMLALLLILALSLMCVLVTTNRKNNLTQDGTQLELKREARVNINRPSFETCPPWECVEICSSHFLIAALFRLRRSEPRWELSIQRRWHRGPQPHAGSLADNDLLWREIWCSSDIPSNVTLSAMRSNLLKQNIALPASQPPHDRQHWVLNLIFRMPNKDFCW